MRAGLACVLACVMVLAPALANGRITIDAHDTRLADVLALLAAESGQNVVADASLRPTKVTLHVHNLSFDEALAVLVKANALQVRREGDVLIVGDAAAMNRRYAGASASLGPHTVLLSLVNANQDDVAKELDDALPPGTVIVADRRTRSVVVTGDADTIARAKELVAALDAARSSNAKGLQTATFPLRFLRADDAAKELKLLAPDGIYAVDESQNAVIASGDRDVEETTRAFVASSDKPSPQVLFEVKVADVTPMSSDSNVGVEWGGINQQGQVTPGSGTYAFTGGTVPISVTLNALVSQGRAQILATPKLLTLNNREASLLIGETYPIVFSTSVLGGQNVQFVDIGVKLRLTPTIGADGTVTAELHPEYSELLGTTSSGYPIITNRKIDSTLRVADAQTIVLGGLTLDDDNESVAKIPGLASIPVFGKLFQNTQIHRERDEVVFLITPHVIYPGAPPPHG